MVIPFLSISHHVRIAMSSLLLLLTNVAYAGVDWTRYDDAPTLCQLGYGRIHFIVILEFDRKN